MRRAGERRVAPETQQAMDERDPNNASQTAGGPSPARRYLPLALDVRATRWLVVGGGRVAARKVEKLVEYGADVTVLAPSLSARLQQAVDRHAAAWRQAEYDSSRLHGFAYVVAAAADPALNIRIEHDAAERNLPTCVVCPGRFSSMIFPAAHTDEEVTVAVHSNGRDCAASKEIRNQIANLLQQRRDRPCRLGVVGVTRLHVPYDVFERLKRAAKEFAPADFGNAEVLFLATCQRWECWFLAPSPLPVVHDVLRLVQERAGVVLERHGSALYRQVDSAAFRHLLRVLTGLDSPLRGETEIVGQFRSALARWAAEDRPRLNDVATECLATQKRIRRESGLASGGGSWAAATVSLLDGHVRGGAPSRVAVVGCGSLGKAVSLRLRERGDSVLPFSTRARAAGVEWCDEHGLAVYPPEALPGFLADLHSVVLTAKLPVQVRQRLEERLALNHLAVVDLTGEGGSGGGDAGGRRFSLEDVGRRPFSGAQAARVECAERLACFYAVKLAAARRCSPQLATPGTYRIGGRSSKLSCAQMKELLDFLFVLAPGATFELVRMGTPGDRDKTTPLPAVRDDDFFTRDIDEALLRGEVDLAVHSAKDLPECMPQGLCVAALTPSYAPWECLVSLDGRALGELPPGAVVGTSSERRRQRLLELRPDLTPREIRGNVPDRLRQLDEGQFDALVLAAVGLVRLELADRISQVFSLEEFPPMPGQGALALVVREDDTDLRHALQPLDLGERDGLPWA